MNEDRLQFWSLYLARFAEGFGFVTLITLLPYYINALEPTDTTVLGLTISAGLIVGLYTTGFTFAQTFTVIPIAWAGDRFDKRTVLLVVLGVGVIVYALFPLVDSSASFIAIRGLQGIVVTGTGLMTLSLVGQLADVGTRSATSGATSSTCCSRSSTHATRSRRPSVAKRIETTPTRTAWLNSKGGRER